MIRIKKNWEMKSWNYWTYAGSIRIISNKINEISPFYMYVCYEIFIKYTSIYFVNQKMINKLNIQKSLNIKSVKDSQQYRVFQ